MTAGLRYAAGMTPAAVARFHGYTALATMQEVLALLEAAEDDQVSINVQLSRTGLTSCSGFNVFD